MSIKEISDASGVDVSADPLGFLGDGGTMEKLISS